MLNTQACSAAISELCTFVGHIRASVKIFNVGLKYLVLYVYIAYMYIKNIYKQINVQGLQLYVKPFIFVI